MKTVKDHTVAVPEDLLSCLLNRVLKKCKDRFDCLVNEINALHQTIKTALEHANGFNQC